MTTHGTRAPVATSRSGLVGALTATHFVARGGGVARAFLVLYLTLERQLSPTTVGVVVAAIGIGDIGSQVLGGWLGDRIGRRDTMLVGFLGTAATLIALGSAHTVPAICAAAVGVGLTAELFRPAGSAAVADLPTQERVRAFGLLFWAANLGYTVSTVAAGILVRYGYGILFWINAAASVVAALIVWRHVPETRPPAAEEARRALLPVLRRDPLMLAMAAIHVVSFAMFLQSYSTLPLVMAGDGQGPGTYSAVLALNGIVIVVVQPIAVRLLDNRDRASVLAVSMLLVGVGGGLGAVVHSGASHAASIVVWTLGQIGIAVLFGATFADLAPADLRGRYMGIASTTWSLGAVLGPLLGTALLDHAGRTALCLASCATGLALFVAQRAVAPALHRRTGRAGGVRSRGRPVADVRVRRAAPTSLSNGATGVPDGMERPVKYMILLRGSQQDYDAMAGKPAAGESGWTGADFAALGTFMESFNRDLVESGELVETRGLTAPVHARRIRLQEGAPVVTDGPYAESEEVLAGYWIVECASIDRATQIAARLTEAPGPEQTRARAVVDLRPVAESRDELEL